jgi:hypothetical protein
MPKFRVRCKVSLKDAPKDGDVSFRSALVIDVEAKDANDAVSQAKKELKDKLSETCHGGKPNTFTPEKIG